MEPTDQRLLERAADGDAEAFAAFFRRHERTVTRAIYSTSWQGAVVLRAAATGWWTLPTSTASVACP